MVTISLLDLLELNHTQLSVNDMIVLLGTVAELVEKHAGYQDKLPDEVPGPPEFRQLASELHLANLAAANKDRAMKAIESEIFQKSAVALAIFGQFAVMRTIKRNDTSYIQGIGLDQKKKSTNSKAAKPGPTGVPFKFAVKHKKDASGCVVFALSQVKGCVHYDIFYCTGDPNIEENWILGTTSVNTRNVELGGLEPGKVYYFRVRCFGANGYGPWSSVIKIMVI